MDVFVRAVLSDVNQENLYLRRCPIECSSQRRHGESLQTLFNLVFVPSTDLFLLARNVSPSVNFLEGASQVFDMFDSLRLCLLAMSRMAASQRGV